jgi:hypothetical protein
MVEVASTELHFFRENGINAKYYSFYKLKFNKAELAFIKVKPATKPLTTSQAIT